MATFNPQRGTRYQRMHPRINGPAGNRPGQEKKKNVRPTSVVNRSGLKPQNNPQYRNNTSRSATTKAQKASNRYNPGTGRNYLHRSAGYQSTEKKARGSTPTPRRNPRRG